MKKLLFFLSILIDLFIFNNIIYFEKKGDKNFNYIVFEIITMLR